MRRSAFAWLLGLFVCGVLVPRAGASLRGEAGAPAAIPEFAVPGVHEEPRGDPPRKAGPSPMALPGRPADAPARVTGGRSLDRERSVTPRRTEPEEPRAARGPPSGLRRPA